MIGATDLASWDLYSNANCTMTFFLCSVYGCHQGVDSTVDYVHDARITVFCFIWIFQEGILSGSVTIHWFMHSGQWQRC